MAASRFRIDREAALPWLAGLAILAGLIWAISWLLDTQQIGGQAMEDEVMPATASAPTIPAEPASSMAPVPLADLLPLGPEDDGFRVTIRGTVVAEPIGTGFWVLTDEDEVIFAQATRSVASGQDIEMTGTLHQVSTAEGAARAAEAELRGAAGWKVHHNLYLAADANPASGLPSHAANQDQDTT